VSQEIPHWPEEQVAIPFAGTGQTFPQDPQLLTSVERALQVLPHFEKPVLQVKPQVLDVQAGVPFGGAEQAFAQEPQFAGSLVVLTQEPLQLVVPEGQEVVQVPPAQTSLAPHTLVQLPQWLLSLWRLTH